MMIVEAQKRNHAALGLWIMKLLMKMGRHFFHLANGRRVRFKIFEGHTLRGTGEITALQVRSYSKLVWNLF